MPSRGRIGGGTYKRLDDCNDEYFLRQEREKQEFNEIQRKLGLDEHSPTHQEYIDALAKLEAYNNK